MNNKFKNELKHNYTNLFNKKRKYPKLLSQLSQHYSKFN